MMHFSAEGLSIPPFYSLSIFLSLSVSLSQISFSSFDHRHLSDSTFSLIPSFSLSLVYFFLVYTLMGKREGEKREESGFKK